MYVSESHILIELSDAALNITSSSQLTSNALTMPWCALMHFRHSPDYESHTRMAPSAPPDYTRALFDDSYTERTESVCPCMIMMLEPAWFHLRTVLSADADYIQYPELSNVMLYTQSLWPVSDLINEYFSSSNNLIVLSHEQDINRSCFMLRSTFVHGAVCRLMT